MICRIIGMMLLIIEANSDVNMFYLS